MAEVYAGKKWKVGDPAPTRDQYANNQDYEAADTAYRQWKSDQKKDTSGAITEKAANQGGPAKSSQAIVDRYNTKIGQDAAVGKVAVQDEDAKRRAMVAAAEKKPAAPSGDEPEPMHNAAEEDMEPMMPKKGAALAEVAAYSKAMAEWKKKKEAKAGGAKSPYPK